MVHGPWMRREIGPADSTSRRRRGRAPAGVDLHAIIAADFRPPRGNARHGAISTATIAKPDFPLSVSATEPLACRALARRSRPAGSQPLRAADDAVTLNFVNADIDAVVKAVGEITGRNFVARSAGQGHDQHRLGAAGAAERSSTRRCCRRCGCRASPRSRATASSRSCPRPTPSSRAGRWSRGAVAARRRPARHRRCSRCKYESAAQLVNVLRPLITPNNTIAAYPAANALVITDYADNLRRIDRIIASLDQPPAGEPIARAAAQRVGARHRAAGQPAARRDGAGGAGAPADAQQRVTLVADPRSNSVLVRADNPARARARARADRAARHAGARRRQHVHRLPEERRRGARRADAARAVQRRRRRGDA